MCTCFSFAVLLQTVCCSDPSSKAGVIAGDHGLLDKTVVHGHVMGKIQLRERGIFLIGAIPLCYTIW